MPPLPHVVGCGNDVPQVSIGVSPTRIEFTRCHTHPVAPAPTPEDLLVFYVPTAAEWRPACASMLAAGFKQLSSFNPYWETRGRTYEDPDGYRIVLQQAEWSNCASI